MVDHLEEAQAAAAKGRSYVEEGRGEEESAHVLLHSAEAHAQIAQAEQTKRIADQLEAFGGDLAPLNVFLTGGSA